MNLSDPTPPRRVTLEHANGERMVAEVTDGSGPAIVFLSGYGSTMAGNKATWLAEQCAIWGWRFIRFDYRGRGQLGGEIGDDSSQDTLSRHLEDTAAVIEQLTDRPVILVGSSMGGWLALRYVLLHPNKVAALVGISAAPDFTTYLDATDDEVVPPNFIEDAKQHLLLHQSIAITCPVALLHGMQDDVVPFAIGLKLAEQLTGLDVTLQLVKNADHSLGRPQDLILLWQTLGRLRDRLMPADA